MTHFQERLLGEKAIREMKEAEQRQTICMTTESQPLPPPKPSIWHRLSRKFTGVNLGSFAYILSAGNYIHWHFFSKGALLGVNQQLDPQDVPDRWLSIGTLIWLLYFVAVSPPIVQVGLLLILVSPLMLYCFPNISDVVMENRAYITLLGIAVLGAYAFQYAPALTIILVLLWAWATIERNDFWNSRFAFWKQAWIETPNKLRPQVNYAVALARAGDLEASMQRYEAIYNSNERGHEAALACANLSLLYTQAYNASHNPEWLHNAAVVLEEGKARWPDNARIRLNRGAMFMGYEKWPEAITEFSWCLKDAPKLVEAWRNRARCWGQLGRNFAHLAQADANEAEKLDGIPGKLRFKDGQ